MFDRSRGFTILELLVVVTILAIVAGFVLFNEGDTRKTASSSAALTEMSSVQAALNRFRRDTGSYPTPTNPADFSALYEQGAQAPWSIDVSRGWRGPYLSRRGEGLVDLGDDLNSAGTGSPATVAASAHEDVRAVADPFVTWPITANSDYQRCDDSAPDSSCLLDWRTQAGDPRHPRWGRPYLLFELDSTENARLVSMGPNGRYESGSCVAQACRDCSPGGDDLVVCLAY